MKNSVKYLTDTPKSDLPQRHLFFFCKAKHLQVVDLMQLELLTFQKNST